MTGRNDDAEAGDTITRMPLRSSGWIGYTDETVFIRRNQTDEESDTTTIALERIAEVSLRTLRWDLAVMSLLLLGIGGLVAATQNPLIGVGFAAVGGWSLYRTYADRHVLVIRVRDDVNPITVHPSEPKQCYDRIGGLVEPARVEDGESTASD